MSSNNVLLGTLRGLALIFAYITVDPLVKEINDTFGSTFLYHPFAVWLTLFSLTYVNTESYQASFLVVAIYEAIKAFWKLVHPPPPAVVKIRKLMSRTQNKEALSDEDLKFLNQITPSNVEIVKDGHSVA